VILHPLSKKTREKPLVRPAFLADEGHALDESGRRVELSKLPEELRVFAPWETVDRFARDGVGELVAWGEEAIRWRHERRGDSHRRRPDVVIVKVPTDPGSFAGGVVEWSDWLRRYGIGPSWSLGSSSMSLLRSTLERELVTTNGALPEPRWTLGGRQQAWHEPGTELGGLVQLDLQAAYTHVIGGLRYGGVWRAVEKPAAAMLDLFHDADLPILAHALVNLPDGISLGPLPRRPQRRPEPGYDELAPNVPYPVAGRLSGLFSYDELRAARDAGARVRVDRAYVHTCGDRVFGSWLDAVLDGRELTGYAGQLAKSTGNALWGQFVIDDRKLLAVLRWDQGRFSRLPVQGSKGHAVRAWDLGELVCGAVRAELFRTLSKFPRRDLVAAHTDGAWLRDSALVDFALPGLEDRGWRVKKRAKRLRLLDQQHYAYLVPRGRSWHYIVSGVPSSQAPELFDRLWSRFTTEGE
jgi:hypothetical protein